MLHNFFSFKKWWYFRNNNTTCITMQDLGERREHQGIFRLGQWVYYPNMWALVAQVWFVSASQWVHIIPFQPISGNYNGISHDHEEKQVYMIWSHKLRATTKKIGLNTMRTSVYRGHRPNSRLRSMSVSFSGILDFEVISRICVKWAYGLMYFHL